jgi:hypothetical protein
MAKPTDQQIQDAHAWYMAEPSRTIMETTKKAGVSYVTLLRRFGQLSLPSKDRSSHLRLRRGATTGTWKGGRTVNTEGYVRILVREDDPYFCMTAGGKNYVLEHRYVMATYLGRPLHSWETVHHNDGNKQNNDISNLQLRIGKHGKGQAYACMNCGSDRIEPVEL